MDDSKATGNVSEDTPDLQPVADDFFSSLEEDVNSIVLEGEQTASKPADPPGTNNSGGNETVVQGEIETLKKRYADSSDEGRRLNAKLSAIEPYMPILEEMKKDPNLVNHVRGYFEGGGQAPKSQVERLGLGEDFVFDPDEAVSNPNSESAKVLEGTVDQIVQRRLNESLSKQQQDNQQMTEEKVFRDEHEMSDGDWADFVSYAKDHKLSLNDILLIRNKDSRDSKIVQNANRDNVDQTKRIQSIPQSMATAGSQGESEATPDDKVFNAILGIDQELESAFG